jgi:hypothetical protein
MLREGKVMKKKNMERVVKDGLVSSGHSKFKKEMAWIEEKDRQGHFFKLKKEQKENLPL